MNNKKIVIVGPPGSGKSTLLEKLEKRGISTFNADHFIHELYLNGNPGYEIIKEHYGEEFVNLKEVDRTILSKAAEKDITKLNKLIHPFIEDELNNGDYQVIELPVIEMSDIKIDFDKKILLKADKDVLTSRVKNLTPFKQEMITWWNESYIKADMVINTNYGIKNEDIEKILELLN